MDGEVKRELDILWEHGIKQMKTDFQRLESQVGKLETKINKLMGMMITQFIALLIAVIAALVSVKG